MSRSFAVTFDYRCPYAWIAHDHVLTALSGGRDWDVAFVPFSLGQAHVEEGEPDIWSRPEDDSGLMALQVGVAVRDSQPGAFLAVHRGLFALRHNRGADLRHRELLTEVVTDAGADAEAVWAEVASGRPLATIEKEHTEAVGTHDVWGVPTFIVDERAVFVRLLEHPADTAEATATVERILDTVDWSHLNEFKHTSIPR